MANKAIVAVVLLFCVAEILEVQARTQLIGSGNIKSSGWFGKKRDYYYHVPSGAVDVTFSEDDRSAAGHNFGSGSGRATLSWTRGSRRAKVHAWVNGKICGFWSRCRANHIVWKVYAHFD